MAIASQSERAKVTTTDLLLPSGKSLKERRGEIAVGSREHGRGGRHGLSIEDVYRFSPPVNLVHGPALLSSKIGFCQANSGCADKSGAAGKSSPEKSLRQRDGRRLR
jgi:hypothetical protein